MARFPHVGSLLCTFAVLAGSAFSQFAMISREEFDRTWKTALAASEKRATQIKATIDVDSDGKVLSTEKKLHQVIRPDRTHMLSVVSSGSKTWRHEEIEVGVTGYRRIDGGPWLEYPVTFQGALFRPSESILPMSRLEGEPANAYSLSDSILNGQAVRVFTAESEDENQGITYSDRESVWISVGGLILKIELVNVQTRTSNIRTKRAVSFWEYDPFGIVIEPPVKDK